MKKNVERHTKKILSFFTSLRIPFWSEIGKRTLQTRI